MLKSIAVVAGSYVLSVVLVMATDPLLSRLFPGDFVKGRIPSDTALMASTAAFAVVSILCAWVCAHCAPSNAAKHGLWFSIVGEAMGLVFTVLGWNKGWPHWYSISWLIVWPVGCWIGLKLSGRRYDLVPA